MAKVTVSAKTYSFTNGTANDATPVDASFVTLFNNDNALKTGVNYLEDGSFRETQTITLNAAYAGAAPSGDGVMQIERGTQPNAVIRWNETTDIWEFTNDGTIYYPFLSSKALLSTKTASNSNEIDFTSFINDALFDDYVIEYQQVKPTNSGGKYLQLLISNDNGANFVTGSQYNYANSEITTAGAQTLDGSSTAAFMRVSNGVANSSNLHLRGEITIFTPSYSSGRRGFRFWANGGNNGGGFSNYTGQGWHNTNTAVDGLRLKFDAGTIASGTFKLWGIPKGS